tara:strand:+ start:871 stop:1071 length:201 start_codon:yes stop_codon:yes gene_type:complete
MYLIFDNQQLAKERNLIEAMRRNCDLVKTKGVWTCIPLKDGRFALKVGDGKGLSKDELAQCVKTIE